MYSSFSTHLVRPIKAENPDNQVIIRVYSYPEPGHTEQSLRHIFSVGAMKEYFYETMPSMANPLGLGHKALPLACKVQNLLIADFLHYLALRHEVYLSTMGDDVKKNFMTKP